eukprot:Gb_04851 [translate_table: standard]
MAIAMPLSIGQGMVSFRPNQENGSFKSSYTRHVFFNKEFMRSKPKSIGRHQPVHRPHWQQLIVKASTAHDLVVEEQSVEGIKNGIEVVSIHHVGLLCANLEKSLEFYQGLLGLEVNEARPNDKLPYRGKWLWVGSEMIHLMELPNPDPLTGRPEHGGRDRHTCIAIRSVNQLKSVFEKAGVSYTLSRSGRPAIFARDPDGNALEFTQVE